MPAMKLIHTAGSNKASTALLVLQIGGIQFKEEELSPEDIAQLRKDGALSSNVLPQLVVDGRAYGGSSAIFRYCAHASGFYPSDALTGLAVDEMLCALDDLRSAGESDVRKVLAVVDGLLSATNGNFLLGDIMSVADLQLYIAVAETPTPVGAFKNIERCFEAVQGNAKVKVSMRKTAK